MRDPLSESACSSFFFKIILFENFFQEFHQSAIQFGSSSESKLFARLSTDENKVHRVSDGFLFQ